MSEYEKRRIEAAKDDLPFSYVFETLEEDKMLTALEDFEDDFEDIDCEDCSIKFFIRPSAYVDRECPKKCPRCLDEEKD
jgi:hypothetical protein